MPQDIIETKKEYKMPIQSDYDLSGKLLEVEYADAIEGYLPVVVPDAAKGNFSPTQHAFLTAATHLADRIASLGQEYSLDLTSSQHEVVRRINAKVNYTRGKGGWSGYLSKTNKSVSEQSIMEKAEQIAQAEQPKKGLMQKILRR